MRPRSRLLVFAPDPGAMPLLDLPPLDPARHDAVEVERGPDHALLEVDGIEHELSVVPAPSLHPWHFEQPRWGEGERAAAERATHAVSLEATLDAPVLGAFRTQLELAAALFEGRSPATFDEGAARLLAASQVGRLAASAALPGAHELFTIHSVGAPGKSSWVHTHGLARAGVPDLDLVGVPAEGRSVAGELLDGAAALLVAHGVPPAGAPFPIGEGLDVVLLPLADASSRLAAADRHERDAEHEGPDRVVLAPAAARTGGSPSIAPLLGSVRRGVLFRSTEDTERMRVLARERFPAFERLLREKPEWIFLVKLGYETDRARERQEDVAREHLWFRVDRLEPGRVHGTLESDPMDVAALRKGDARWHDLARLTDWRIVTPAGELGPEASSV